MFRDRNKWRVRWSEDGQSRSKTFDLKQDAALFEAKLRSGVSSVATLEQEALTFSAWAERWFNEYAKIEKSETTWSTDLSSIRMHLNPVLGSMRLIDLKQIDGHRLKTSLIEKGIKPKTVNNVLALAKKILTVAVSYELIPANPFQMVKAIKVPKQSFRFWTREESERFLKRCKELDPEFYVLCLVALRTGMRLGELHALTRSALDFETDLIRVRATFSVRLGKRMERTKNGEIGYCSMTPSVREALLTKKLMKSDQPVFRPQMVQYARDRLQVLIKRANVPLITFHDLRHSFASQLAFEGVDIYRIQKLMRHKDVKMTQRYAHLRPEELKGAANILESVPSANRPQVSEIRSHKIG